MCSIHLVFSGLTDWTDPERRRTEWTAHDDAAEFIDRQRFFLDNLMPGKLAPNIVRNDTEGAEFALDDYHGRIVVVIFSGQWCGPCHGQPDTGDAATNGPIVEAREGLPSPPVP